MPEIGAVVVVRAWTKAASIRHPSRQWHPRWSRSGRIAVSASNPDISPHIGAHRGSRLVNGGDLSGLIRDIQWSSWGGPEARGKGRHSIFRPGGGYYRQSVTIQLRAKQVGPCEGRTAYLRLLVREPRRPGGTLGPWRSWAGPQTICEPYGSSFSDRLRTFSAPTAARTR